MTESRPSVLPKVLLALIVVAAAVWAVRYFLSDEARIRRQLGQDRRDLGCELAATGHTRRRVRVFRPEGGQVAEVELATTGSGDELRSEEHEQQPHHRVGLAVGDVRLRVVDEEHVPGFGRQASPSEAEATATLEHLRDLEVVVPVHRVDRAVDLHQPVVGDVEVGSPVLTGIP